LHVAGTNGKGSVCAMLYAALKHVRLTVGMFNSPYLIAPLDSVKLARGGLDVPTDWNTWSQLDDQLAKSCEGHDLANDLTPFEKQVVTALLYFEHNMVDVAIMEVGLGGRTDATNILERPAVCAITSIAKDHDSILGSTCEEIAWHKAGIFQKGRPALIACSGLSTSVQGKIAECAQDVGASPIMWVKPAELICSVETKQVMHVSHLSSQLEVPLLGAHQCSNVALAVATLLNLRSQGLRIQNGSHVLNETVLSDDAIAKGISKTRWPGRLQWLCTEQFGRILLDGAHNVQAVQGLVAYVNEMIRNDGRAVVWIVAMTDSKDTVGMLREVLSDDRDSLIAIPFSAVTDMPWIKHHPPMNLVSAARSVRPGLRSCRDASTLSDALYDAQKLPGKPQIVVCGSLYLVADFFRLNPQVERLSAS